MKVRFTWYIPANPKHYGEIIISRGKVLIIRDILPRVSVYSPNH